MKKLHGERILALAVIATLLAGGKAWAVTSGGETGYTVNFYNNTGTQQNPYTKITIDKGSVNSKSYLLNVYKNESSYAPIYVQQGILLDKDKATTQTTYLGTGTTISVNSTGLDVSKSGYDLNSNIGAVGIMNYGTSNANVLTVSAAGPITINAQVEAGTGTGTDYVNKGALAVGVLNTNGKKNGSDASGVININQPLTITATLRAVPPSALNLVRSTNDICAGAQAWAYGLYNYADTGTITVGQVDITASAQGGSVTDPQ